MRTSTVRWQVVTPRGLCLVIPPALWLLCSATALYACQACIPYPEKTAADYLIEADTIVFARENPERPFSYSSTAALKGSAVEDIDLFLNSSARRLLAADEERVAVLVRSGDGTWKSLGVADREYQQVVQRIVVFANEWKGVDGEQQRLQFFVDLFGHENRQLFRLAYLELGRAPYSTLKRISSAVSPEQLRRLLHDLQYIEWRPLAILLLANTGEPADCRHIRDSFHAAERFSLSRSLAALATASIELDETPAVQFIEDEYFRERQRSREELVEVTRALSVHGSDGHVHLRDRIIDSYRVLLETHPEMAPMVATDLVAWQRWDLVEQIAAIADTDTVIADTDIMARYLEMAVAANDND